MNILSTRLRKSVAYVTNNSKSFCRLFYLSKITVKLQILNADNANANEQQAKWYNRLWGGRGEFCCSC
jgi:hypothetical protein